MAADPVGQQATTTVGKAGPASTPKPAGSASAPAPAQPAEPARSARRAPREANAEPRTHVAAGPSSPLVLLGASGTPAPYTFYLGAPDNWGVPLAAAGVSSLDVGSIAAAPARVGDVPGVRVVWRGGIGQAYIQSRSTVDLSSFRNGVLVFDAIVHRRPEGQLTIRMDCQFPCVGVVDATAHFRRLPVETLQTVRIPMACLVATGLKPTAVNTPWLLYTPKPFALSIANVRMESEDGSSDGTVKCAKD